MLRVLARTGALALVLGPLSSLTSSPVSSPEASPAMPSAPSRVSAPSHASVPSHASASKVVLYCARSSADYPDAELILSETGPHVLHVVYVGYRPSRQRADWALRDCLYTAGRLDGARDIVASLWVREREPRAPRELILHCLTQPLQSLPIGARARPIMPPCPDSSH